MPNVSTGHAKKLSALIAEIEAEAYARGRADARKELLDLVAAGGGAVPRAGASRGRPAGGTPRSGGRKRAPRGSVPPFVERVLRDNPGSTVQEIPGHAGDDTERSIKLPSIRNELHTGRKQGKYAVNGRRWSLASSDPGAAGTGEADPPDAESRGTLGLTW